MNTSSISSRATASDVYTQTGMNNALSAKADQSTTYTKTEVHNALADKLRQQTPGDPANPIAAPIATSFSKPNGQIMHQGLSCSITLNHLKYWWKDLPVARHGHVLYIL